jgi:hypothetical protein
MGLVNTRAMLLAAIVGAGVASHATAETLYKLVAPDGKVTYVQEPPKNFDGKVIRLDIDVNANTAEGRRGGATNESVIRGNTDTGRVKKLAEAQAKLDAARTAYERARDNPGEGDVQRVGKVGGGARPVFSEEYQQKLTRLEADVKQAQAELEKLERGR